jgi:hypothetical protein
VRLKSASEAFAWKMNLGLQRYAGSLRNRGPLETSLIQHAFVTIEWIAGLLASRLAVEGKGAEVIKY